MCPFTDSISEKKSKTQIDNAENIDVVIPKYSLIDYSVSYFKTSGSLWRYYRDQPPLDNSDAVTDFVDGKTGTSFKFKQKIKTLKAYEKGDNGTKTFFPTAEAVDYNFMVDR